MPGIENQFGEQEPKPLWKELIGIDKLIDDTIKNIDLSGSDFLAREEIQNQLRKKYKWHEKWASSTSWDRRCWAKERPDNKFGKNTEKLAALAEKNYATALNIYNQGKVEETLSRIENDTWEDLAKQLEEIENLIDTVGVKIATKKFLAWILGLKNQVVYKDLTDNDLTYFHEYQETLESNIDDLDFLSTLLPEYIGKIAEIIRNKKKKLK